ncbi:MAG: hypothetical protein ACRCWS_02635 [Propionibacteriaceae bacterium]
MSGENNQPLRTLVDDLFGTSTQPKYGRRRALSAAAVLTSFAVLITIIAWAFAPHKPATPPLPTQNCLAQTAAGNLSLSHEQLGIAAIVAGVAIREGLGERGAAIGLATAWQESSLRNLDYGDRDSLGVFQQRSSQGWGTPEQIRDPYYATLTFYEAMQQLTQWESGDINDIAQTVQRSGVPDGYRKHVENATGLAQVLAGQTPAAITCISRSTAPSSADVLLSAALKTYSVQGTAAGQQVTFQAATVPQAWQLAYLALGHSDAAGVVSIEVGPQRYTIGTTTATSWTADGSAAPTTVIVTLR